jgi:hypothetical protein
VTCSIWRQSDAGYSRICRPYYRRRYQLKRRLSEKTKTRRDSEHFRRSYLEEEATNSFDVDKKRTAEVCAMITKPPSNQSRGPRFKTYLLIQDLW